MPIRTSGRSVGAILDFDHPQAAALTTLMTAQMLQRGYLSALDEVFAEPAKAIAEDDIAKRIGGPVKHTGFNRLT
jgi:glutamate-1-semialdehyde 2,1-aminomutase